MSSLIVPEARLADMTDRTVLGWWGLTAEVGAGDDYVGTRLWAQRLWQAGFAGVWYQARHDPSANLHSIALFAKPGLQPSAFIPAGSTSITDDIIDEAERIFGIEVFPAAPLPRA